MKNSHYLLLLIAVNFLPVQAELSLCLEGYAESLDEKQQEARDLPLYYWQAGSFTNFGDYLSLKLVERMLQKKVTVVNHTFAGKKLFAIGSIISKASTGDVIWGAGIKGLHLQKKDYKFTALDVRAVRGPLTRAFLLENFGIKSPQIYGDPALLIPYFFPEFKRQKTPKYPYIIIPHYSEEKMFPKDKYPHAVYPSEPWNVVIQKILDSKFVISSSLHGIILAEAFKIPARFLRITDHEPLFKYQDYYEGTGRKSFTYATSVQQALSLGGEPPYTCDLKALIKAFPFDYWPAEKREIMTYEECVKRVIAGQ